MTSLPNSVFNGPTSDPYMFDNRIIDRLIKQYNSTPKLIIAVDFDDTVFDFHNQGHEYAFVISLVQRCQALGFYIVMFTASREERFSLIEAHMMGLGIKVDAINKNPVPGLDYGNNSKIFYNVLLDDRAGLGQAYRTLESVVARIELQNQINDTNKTAIAA